MIELKQVTFRYDNAPENAHSIRNINLTIQNGACVVLCGRSGCGKTTITRLINGLIPHYYEGDLSGYVSVNGAEIKNQQLSKISQRVGSVFQNPRSQFFNVDTTSELAFGCENQGLPKEDVLERIADAANHFSLNGLLNRSIFELSGGEKQRIACASVYAVHPDIFVLDEPSSNLDPASIQQLKDVLLKLKAEGKTLVISEHRLYYLLDIADRFIWLDQGEVRSVYTREEILAFSPAQISAMGLRALDLKQVEGDILSAIPCAVEEQLSRRKEKRPWLTKMACPQRHTLKSNSTIMPISTIRTIKPIKPESQTRKRPKSQLASRK